jgi:hypothetical protein
MYKVEGYEFETKAQAHAALQEVKKIRYFKSQTSMDDPDVVLALYNKLVERDVFVTPVGIGYLSELQQYLKMVPYIKEADILPIPVYEPNDAVKDAPTKKVAEKRRKEKARELKRLKSRENSKNRDYRRLFHVSMFFTVVFALAVMGMLAMSWASVDNVNIINYENEIINKYESWEQELNEREQELNEREEKLDMQEGQE